MVADIPVIFGLLPQFYSKTASPLKCVKQVPFVNFSFSPGNGAFFGNCLGPYTGHFQAFDAKK